MPLRDEGRRDYGGHSNIYQVGENLNNRIPAAILVRFKNAYHKKCRKDQREYLNALS